MAVVPKTPEEIEKMRVAGRMAAEVLSMIAPHVVPGVTTEHLNTLCHEYITGPLAAVPAPLNYHGFPKSICTSVNHQVCHGIPCDKPLKEGDILNIDVTVLKDGYHGDTSIMLPVGKVSRQAERLMTLTHHALWVGIHQIRAGARLGDIGAAIQALAHQNHYSIVEEYCGHGIGAVFHEAPQVLHYGIAGTGLLLEPGMIFTIEPMLNVGKKGTRLLSDGWTVVTKDRSLSAQWEHTLLVTEEGYEVLTLREGEQDPIAS